MQLPIRKHGTMVKACKNPCDHAMSVSTPTLGSCSFGNLLDPMAAEKKLFRAAATLAVAVDYWILLVNSGCNHL